MTDADAKVEVVVVATDRADALEAGVRRVHAALVDRAARPWMLTIAESGQTGHTAEVAARLAHELPHVRVVGPEWDAVASELVASLELGRGGDLEALLDPVAPRPFAPSRITRRTALSVIGGLSTAAVLAACSGTSSNKPAVSRPSTTARSGTTPALAAEMTDGPYYLDLNLVRHDITEDRKGARLALGLAVVDPTGAPVKGAAVDIWHCDAVGLYSGFVGASAGANGDASGSTTKDDGTFLRGTQITGTDGKVGFTTIYPGWYRGRTVHIHVKVHAGGSVVHTGQLFFDDAFTDTVFAAGEPYSSRPNRDVRNRDDSIYADGGDRSMLDVKKQGASYATQITTAVST
jgi:protocatechuate 3,4-dioxygenase beta subunit